MRLTWQAIVAVLLAIMRLFSPPDKLAKWEAKREGARAKLKEVDHELINVTVELVHAKKNGQDAVSAGLDMRRQRLLQTRADCQWEYDYFKRLCNKTE